MAYDYARLLIYFPSLTRLGMAKEMDRRFWERVKFCVTISHGAVALSERIWSTGHLLPGAWHLVYTTFLSGITHICFPAARPGHRECRAIREAAVRGIRVLCATSCSDTGSRRGLGVLEVGFSFPPSRGRALTQFRVWSVGNHTGSTSTPIACLQW